MAVTTPLTIEAADDVAFELLGQHPELLGVEGCEEFADSITYTFESGHWAEVFVGNHGITHQLHQPDEE
jgi:hypothetical protein